MDIFIYLDQNTLSDLRPRKLEESNDESLLTIFKALSNDKVHLLYSHVHLTEIEQIPKAEYQNEHIGLLTLLKAIYIEPLTQKLNSSSPDYVWSLYLENERDNLEVGIKDVAMANEMISRKMSGLPVEENFKELGSNLRSSLSSMLHDCEGLLNAIDDFEMDENGKQWLDSLRRELPSIKQKAEDLKTVNIDSKQELGPKPFRNWEKLKKLVVESLPIAEVIPRIDQLFESENSDYNWKDYFDDTVQNQIARCYSLMNWAGYHADDFDKVKKRKDRFRASNNDMMHATMAAGCHFLISNDHAFVMKARACYEYLKLPVAVRKPDEFVELHCRCL